MKNFDLSTIKPYGILDRIMFREPKYFISLGSNDKDKAILDMVCTLLGDVVDQSKVDIDSCTNIANGDQFYFVYGVRTKEFHNLAGLNSVFDATMLLGPGYRKSYETNHMFIVLVQDFLDAIGTMSNEAFTYYNIDKDNNASIDPDHSGEYDNILESYHDIQNVLISLRDCNDIVLCGMDIYESPLMCTKSIRFPFNGTADVCQDVDIPTFMDHVSLYHIINTVYAHGDKSNEARSMVKDILVDRILVRLRECVEDDIEEPVKEEAPVDFEHALLADHKKKKKFLPGKNTVKFVKNYVSLVQWYYEDESMYTSKVANLLTKFAKLVGIK